MNLKSKNMNWHFIEKIGKIVSDNGSTLSMVAGILTLVGALYAAYKASDAVSEINADYAEEMAAINSTAVSEAQKAKEIKELKTMRNLKLVCAEKWTIALGTSSAGFIFLTKYLDGLAISGLTAVAMTQQDKIKSIAEHAKEVVGEDKFKEIENKSLEDLVLKNFVKDGENVAIKPNAYCGQIYLESDTGVLFQMESDDLKEAFKLGESYYARNHELFQEKWFGMLGLECPEGGKVKCWGPKNSFKPHIEKRTIHGATFDVIEYEHIPQPRERAGVPKRHN